MKNYNSQYAAYMDANNHVNNVIIEYIEGIEVVKAFNQSTSSYEKFAGAVQSFKDFTLAWFKSTWKTMNLMMAIMPTTLLGVLPVGLLLTQNGTIAPAELAMCIILSLSIVGPLMKATTFINEAKSMEWAVESANELLNLPKLLDSGKTVPLTGTDITLQNVSFSYDGAKEHIHGAYQSAHGTGQFYGAGRPVRWRQINGGPPDRPLLGCYGWQHLYWRGQYKRAVHSPTLGVSQFCNAGQFSL